MSILNNGNGLLALVFPGIPQANDLIIPTGTNHMRVEIVPINVFHYIRMILKSRLGMNDSPILSILQSLIDIPNTHSLILRTGYQLTFPFFTYTTPSHSISFTSMPSTNHLRRRRGTLRRETRMLAKIPNVNFWRRSPGSNDEMVLRHEPCTVDFPIMWDFHTDFNLAHLVHGGVAAQFILLFVVVGCESGRGINCTITTSLLLLAWATLSIILFFLIISISSIILLSSIINHSI